ncbi:hypothetical protein PPMP20_05335 [Paraburkholderia phymatum]|uniref:Conserved hypothetical secreted protein n=1 Tax=Paraburkholderia phymatum (strain DSM 17167 / CIP 108236 / LMG 21445 / STM815) TaxID=391038 RepID=B2JKR0_PARP8|nr:hypothetical protein [Paraburkholderia phymatum]ACC70887.1 conserved hypothetical secreted protein [Paraburkholderia phymatum STM815]
MQRRTFIAAAAWLPATAAWRMPWLLPDGLRADMALIDGTLPEAAALSMHAERMQVPVIDLGVTPHTDIAALWYDALAPRAARAEGRLTLIGATRAADFFVLARLALPPAARTTHARCEPRRTAVAFALTI